METKPLSDKLSDEVSVHISFRCTPRENKFIEDVQRKYGNMTKSSAIRKMLRTSVTILLKDEIDEDTKKYIELRDGKVMADVVGYSNTATKVEWERYVDTKRYVISFLKEGADRALIDSFIDNAIKAVKRSAISSSEKESIVKLYEQLRSAGANSFDRE